MDGDVLTEQFDDKDEKGHTREDVNSTASKSTTEHVSYMEEHATITNNQDSEENGYTEEIGNTQTEMKDVGGNMDKDVTNINDETSSTLSDQLPTEDNDNSNDEGNMNNDDIDKLMEDPYDDWITIDNINIVTEINTS